jgi:hypothetical protein
MKKWLLIFTLFFLVFLFSNNCKNEYSKKCISAFEFKFSTTPNPAAIVFKIYADKELRDILLSEKWDSIKFSGGFLDTLDLRNRTVGVAESSLSSEILLGLPTAKFVMYTQHQMDSIALKTYEKVEINVFSKNGTWILKPCGKSGIKQ